MRTLLCTGMPTWAIHALPGRHPTRGCAALAVAVKEESHPKVAVKSPKDVVGTGRSLPCCRLCFISCVDATALGWILGRFMRQNNPMFMGYWSRRRRKNREFFRVFDPKVRFCACRQWQADFKTGATGRPVETMHAALVAQGNRFDQASPRPTPPSRSDAPGRRKNGSKIRSW